MTCLSRLLTTAAVVMLAGIGTGLAQTQRQINTLGSSVRDGAMPPGGGASWKKECEARAKEKGFKGNKRKSLVEKCVSLGALPDELR